MPAIETSGLTKRYGDHIAVDDLDLRIENGEAFGLLGPNGAGKSTTIDVLRGVTRPTAGTVRVLGTDPGDGTDAFRSRVGVLPDAFEMEPSRSGRRHIETALEAADADDDPDAIRERIGLSAADLARPVGEYAAGVRRRLAVGMALSGDPDLLLLDAPFTGLDRRGVREVQTLVAAAVQRGTTAVLSSHRDGHVRPLCDRVGVVADGRLVAVETVEERREGATMTLTLADPAEWGRNILDSIAGVTVTGATGRTLTCVIADPATKARVVTGLDDAGATIRDLVIETTPRMPPVPPQSDGDPVGPPEG
ncbi:ABC transporter ATP-binding protein [Halopiger djelfimassiliensis]|uniref:ABC transporter ATP-binding protein n=1 Tax=Halopiger djelfimassiliensis TaxID=1293047 RepID=UPI0006782610|nr:ATP-binding cassette domain-containing protein [Halopiger djelfimassiliensis]